jgi:hypothetical protein
LKAQSRGKEFPGKVRCLKYAPGDQLSVRHAYSVSDCRSKREESSFKAVSQFAGLRDDMGQKLYLIISGTIFFLVGVFHLFRLVYHWQIFVGPSEVPYSLSYVGCPVSLSYSAWACWLLIRTWSAGQSAARGPKDKGGQ